MIHILMKHKQEFYDIFDNEPTDVLEYMTCNGEISYDELIRSHLTAWIKSRIWGISASLAFYAEATDAILLIDKLARENFI